MPNLKGHYGNAIMGVEELMSDKISSTEVLGGMSSKVKFQKENARLEWRKIIQAIRKPLTCNQIQSAIRAFDLVWTKHDIICSRTNMTIRWNLIPCVGINVCWF